MRNTLNLCRGMLFWAALCLLPGVALASGFSDKFAEKITNDLQTQEQIKTGFDAVEAEVESFASKGETTRGASGPMMQLLYSSDTLICSAWIISFRQELQRLVVSDFLDPPLALIRAAQDLLSRVERACQGVLQPGTATSVTTPAAGGVATPPPSDAPPAGQPFTPRPGWSITDEICARKCSAESAAVQRTDWRKYDAEIAEKNARDQLTRDERELASERENLARAAARRESANASLARYEAFAKSLPPSQDGRSNVDNNLTAERANAAGAAREESVARNRVAAKETAVTSSRSALDRATADRVRAEQDAANARAALDRCLRDCHRQAKGQDDKSAKLQDKTAERTKVSADKDRRSVLKDGEPPAKDGKTEVKPPPRDKMGGGMTQIDPPPPRESILDSIDDGNFRRAPAPTAPVAAACPDCTPLASRLAEQQAELTRESAELDRLRKNFSNATVDQDRRVPEDPQVVRAKIILVEQTEADIRRQAQKVEGIERGIDTLRRQIEACNRNCAPQPPGQSGAAVVPDTSGAHLTRCSACNHMGRRQGELERERAAKEAERDRLSREAQEISGRAMDGKAQPGDGSRLQERRRRIETLTNEIDEGNRQTERLEREMRECERTACPPPKTEDGRKDAAIRKGDQVGPAGGGAGGGGGCYFQPAKPVTIGPREQFGYGADQKAGEIGKAALGILGGFLGGRGGGGGGGPFQAGPPGGGKPQLADDPIRDKQTFTDTQSGTAIQVGAQYRPDGKLLVSVGIDKAEDKGVVHQAAMERLQYLPSGGCATQVAEPIEWLHYEIWEDWWAKIRIQRYESVDGGPWRKTHDTGWRDWASGTRLLESGTMTADQIPHTAWGSMGADRAFGGPRSAGAVFDPGKPMVTGQPASERLVVHVTQPGKDPVTTLPFTLYPTYGADGKVNYTDQAPDWEALRRMRMQRVPDKAGGGMQQIDPPATGAAPRESILDSIDSGVGKTPLAK